MKGHVFRVNMLTACSTCGAEWFGAGGEAAARRHASETGHQVEVHTLQRETINLVAEGAEPNYAPLVQLSPEELTLSVKAARDRVTLFEGPIGQRVAR